MAKKFFEYSQKNQILSADVLRVMTTEQKQMIARDFGISTSKIYVIRHGTNSEVFFDRGKAVCREKLSIAPEKYVFCFVGTFNYMEYIEGLKYFLRGYKIFINNKTKETELLLLGDGKHRHILESYASELGIREYVNFTGMINNHDVPDYISASDLCLQTWIPEKKEVEGLSLKISSYLACERRILACDMNGFRKILSPFDTLFWKMEDDESMKKCIFKAYEEKAIWDSGKKQREYVLNNFTWDISADKIIQSFMDNKKVEEARL
jgi:glycosyltransferase involved in cell wall biosynthesis